MAIRRIKTLIFFFALLSFIFGTVFICTKPRFGTPVISKNGVTCKFSYDTTIKWVYCSVAFLVAYNVVVFLVAIYTHRKSSVFSLLNDCMFYILVFISGVSATLLLSPLIQQRLLHKVHHHLNYACCTTDLPMGGAFFSLFVGIIWSLLNWDSENFPKDNNVNGDTNDDDQHIQSHDDNVSASLPAAGGGGGGLNFNPISSVADEIIHYDIPSVVIDLSPVDISSPAIAAGGGGGCSSSCVICLVAPAEGACVPCGHVVGCMTCLNEVMKTNKLQGCPVCRAKVDQVMKLYHV